MRLHRITDARNTCPNSFTTKFQRGAGRNRTDEWEICSLLPYHLATAPREGKLAIANLFLKANHVGIPYIRGQ